MKNLFLVLMLISTYAFGQGITINYPTPVATVDNTPLTVEFTPTGGASGPFTVTLYQTITYQFQYNSCTLPNSTSAVVSNTGSTSPITLTLPSSMEASGTTSSYLQCGQFSYNNYYKTVAYYLVVSNNSVQSPNYNIVIKPTVTGTAFKSLSLSQPQVCQGGNLNVNFQHQGVNSGNTFTIAVSDQNGSFTTPLVSTTVAGNVATTASLTIPANAPSSSAYKLKVSASDLVASIETALSIGVQTPVLDGSNSFCENTPITFTSNYYASNSSGLSFEWQKNGSVVSNSATNPYEYLKNNAVAGDAAQYKLKVTHTALGCNAISVGKTITIDAAPSPPTTAPLTVVSGNTATLTATNCTGGTILWYAAATGGSYITTGSYTTPELTQQTTYYASCKQNSGSYCESPRTPLVVSIDATNAPPAPTLTASANNFCAGSATNPTLTATGCTGIVRWYYKYSLTDTYFYLGETDNAAPYEYNISNYTTRIYAADCRVGGALSTTKTQITITVNPIPSLPSVSPNYVSVNNGSSVTFTASGCSGTVKWFADNSTQTVLATGNTYTTVALVNNDPNNYAVYSIYYSCTVNSCESSRSSNGVYIYNSLQYPSFSYADNNNNVCSGSTKIIYAQGCSNGTVNWYDASSGGNLLATAQSYTTPVLTYNNGGNNYYYYHTSCTIGGNTSSRNSASLYVNGQPTTPSANQPTIACNATATLTATGCNTNSPDYFSVYWYADATSTNSIWGSSSFTTPSLSVTTTYYVQCQGGGGCKSARIPITVTVSCAPPDAPVIATNLTTVCAGVGVNLTATGCTGGTINWSDGGTGASRMGVIFNTSVPSLTATCTIGSLSSGNSNALTITVNPKPNLVITNPAPVAPPTTVNITLAAVTTGSTLPSGTALSYHTDAAGMIAMSSPPATAVNASGTYYIKATLGNCSDIKPVVVTINNCNTALNLVSTADDYSSGTHLKKTNEAITATNIISGTAIVTYRSNKSVTLSPQNGGGFKADNGVVFKVEIGGCN